jgi:hypothetical protein
MLRPSLPRPPPLFAFLFRHFRFQVFSFFRLPVSPPAFTKHLHKLNREHWTNPLSKGLVTVTYGHPRLHLPHAIFED